MATSNSLPANKKARVENIDLFNSLSSAEISCIFSYFDPLFLIQSITIINKHFNSCVETNCTHLWREYCELRGINNVATTWMSTAKMDLQSNLNIQKLIILKFPTVRDGRYEIQSKYIHDVIKDGLIEHISLNGGYEYASKNQINPSKVKCDDREILIMDSFVVQTFNNRPLRSLGNIKPEQMQQNDVWEGYNRRADMFWKSLDKNNVEQWLKDALLPGDYTYNLYCINNRKSFGRWAKTQEERKEDESYITSAERFIAMVIDTFANRNSYRFYTAAHIASSTARFDLDRDEIFVAINEIKAFGFYVYYSRCYG